MPSSPVLATMAGILPDSKSKNDAEPNILAVTTTNDMGASEVVIKTYKRRYIGLAELALLNMSVAWNWTHTAPVVGQVMEHFHASLAAVNWFSTAFLLACFCGNLPAAFALRRGPKFSMVCCAAIMGVGVWLKYAGTRINNIGLALFGQCLCGFSQPFVLNAPVIFAEQWFTVRSATLATAIAFFMSPFGSLIASLVSPEWMKSPEEVVSATLYLSIITSICCVIAPFVPNKPPTPPAIVIAEKEHVPAWTELKMLNRKPEFHILIWLFTVLCGVFNCYASIQWMLMAPYGFTDSNIGLSGALLTAVGLGFSLIVSPLADRLKCHLWILKSFVGFTFIFLLIFIWAPPTGSLGFVLSMSCLISMFTVGSTAVFEAFLAEVLHPIGPEIALSIMWAGSEGLGAILITGTSYMTDSKGTYQPAMYLVAGFAFLAVPLCWSLGMFGRKDAVNMKKSKRDREIKDELDAKAGVGGTV